MFFLTSTYAFKKNNDKLHRNINNNSITKNNRKIYDKISIYNMLIPFIF